MIPENIFLFIKDACERVINNSARHIETDFVDNLFRVVVYRAGNIVRVDIKIQT